MRDPDVCNVEYCGFKEPRTPEELEFEILGLKTAICEARKRVATLKQSRLLVEVTMREDSNDNSNNKKS
jgi:hypothetical protein